MAIFSRAPNARYPGIRPIPFKPRPVLDLSEPEKLFGGGTAGNFPKKLGSHIGLTVELDPTPLMLFHQFDKFAGKVRSLKEPLTQAIRQVVIPSIQQNFIQGGRPPWMPLSDLTIYNKAMAGVKMPHRPLIRFGHLQREAGKFSLWKVDGGYTTGTASAYIADLPQSVWYGKVHQRGMSVGLMDGTTVEIPQRPWAILQPEDVDDINRIFESRLGDKVRTSLR